MAKNTFENTVVKVEITATSDKFDEKYKSEVNTKTAYLKADETNTEILERFGLTKYTSKDDGEDFFILKLARNVRVYLKQNGEMLEPINGEVTKSPNFKTNEVYVNIIKGENLGQLFFRLQAILVNDPYEIEELEAQNPFEALVDKPIEGFKEVNIDDIPY